MKMLVLGLIFVFSSSLLLSTKVLALSPSERGVKVHVDTTGPFSFTCKSEKVRRSVMKKGEVYTAKGLYVRVVDLDCGTGRTEHAHEALSGLKVGGKNEALKAKIARSKITVHQATGQNGKGVALIEINSTKKKIPFVFKDHGKTVKIDFELNYQDFGIEKITAADVPILDQLAVKNRLKVEAVFPLSK